MTPTVVICTSEEIDANNFKLTCSDTSYLRTGSVFVHNENTYTVTSFEVNKELTIEGTPRITDELITLRNPFFITDTPQGANNELSLESANLELHPFVWLLENFPTNYQDPSNQYVGQSRVRLFFLDVSENNYWLNEDHRKECVEPMRNLINQFLVDLQYKVSGEINLSASNLSLTDRVRFGVYTGDKGNTKSIFNDQLSGVEVDINIPVKKYAADNCASLALIPSPIIQHGCQGEGGGGTTFFTDEFKLIDRATGNEVVFNAEGQTGNITLYSFESGAFVIEPETPNIQNVTDGYIFFWIPNIPKTFQVTANHNPTSWALVNAPAGVTIDNNGLISWDGLGDVVPSTMVTIQAINQFGTGSVNVEMLVTSSYAGSPTLALDTLQISGSGFNEGDTVQTWVDASGSSNDFDQSTLADRPTIKIDAFASGVNGLRFDGVSQFMTGTTLSSSIYNVNSGNIGEIFVAFRFDGSFINSVIPIYWSNRTVGSIHLYITYLDTFVTGIQVLNGGGGANVFPFTPVLNTNYIIRFAWVGNNYVEMEILGQSTIQQAITTTPTVTAANSYNIIAGGDENTDVNSFSKPLYADITYGVLVCYPQLLTAEQRQANFDYIESLWNPA